MVFNKMNRILFYFLICSFFSCTEKEVSVKNIAAKADISSENALMINKKLLNLKPAEGLVYHENKPFTGISIAYYQPNVKAETIQYLKGKKMAIIVNGFPMSRLALKLFIKMVSKKRLLKHGGKMAICVRNLII